jgi:hypothetical protein
LVVAVVALWLMPGLAFAQLTWREIDRGSQSLGSYVWALALLVLLWPKAIYDIRRGR